MINKIRELSKIDIQNRLRNKKAFTLIETLMTIVFGAAIVIMFAQAYGTAYRVYSDLELQDAMESEFSKAYEFLLSDRTLLVNTSNSTLALGVAYSFRTSTDLATMIPMSLGSVITPTDCKNNTSLQVDTTDLKYKVCTQLVIKQKDIDKYCAIITTVAKNAKGNDLIKQERLVLNKKIKLSGTVGQAAIQTVSGVANLCN